MTHVLAFSLMCLLGAKRIMYVCMFWLFFTKEDIATFEGPTPTDKNAEIGEERAEDDENTAKEIRSRS